MCKGERKVRKEERSKEGRKAGMKGGSQEDRKRGRKSHWLSILGLLEGWKCHHCLSGHQCLCWLEEVKGISSSQRGTRKEGVGQPKFSPPPFSNEVSYFQALASYNW